MLSVKSKLPFKILLASLSIAAFGNANAQSPDWLWAKSFGGPGFAIRTTIAVDPAESGDVYTIGTFEGTFDFDPGEGIFNITSAGSPDMFICKLDGSGNFVWATAIGGSGGHINDPSIAVDPGSGDIYTTGNFWGTVDFDSGTDTFTLTSIGDGDGFILKLDGLGNFLWAKDMGGTGFVSSNALAVDPASGDTYTTGSFSGTIDFDPGPGTFLLTSATNYNMFISKLDGSGNFVWAKAMVGSGSYGLSIAVDPGTSDVYTTGSFWGGEVDFDPGMDTFYLGSSLSECWVHWTPPPLSCVRMFISKLDSSGNFAWVKKTEHWGGSEGISIVLDPSGNGDIYTTGSFDGSVDFDPGAEVFNMTSAGSTWGGSTDMFIYKLNSLGNFVWVKSMGGLGYDVGNSIALCPSGSGDIYTTGTFSGTVDIDPGDGTFNLTSAGGTDMFISTIDNSGNFIWAKAIGGIKDDYGSVISLDASGYVHVAGSFYSHSLSFGSTILTNEDTFGTRAIFFVAKLDTAFTTSVFEVEKSLVNIYPNPATNELTIEFDEGEFLTVRITMFNFLGEVVFSTPKESIAHHQTIDISSLATGIYFIELNMEGERVMKKVVKVE